MASLKQAQAFAGGPLVQARNIAVMTGVHAGISCVMRRLRGKEDVQSSCSVAIAVEIILNRGDFRIGVALHLSSVKRLFSQHLGLLVLHWCFIGWSGLKKTNMALSSAINGAIISVLVTRIEALLFEQLQKEINLIKGVDKEILNLSQELRTIHNIFDDAERQEYKSETLKDWLKRLEEASYQMDDVLDEWFIALHKAEHRRTVKKKASWLSIFPRGVKKIGIRHDIGKKIRNAKEVLGQILSERVRYDFIRDHPSINTSWRFQSTSFIDVSEVCGRDSDKEALIEKLIHVDGSERLRLQVVSLVGIGGIGKTTLAQLTYNDARVQEHFELKFWICVSRSIDAAEIAKGILTNECPQGGQLDSKLEALKKKISERKFILVLDNVWEVNLSQWDTLKNILRFGCHGSKVLLTTRNKGVARMLDCLQEDIQDIGVLPDEDCWQILSSIAFFGRREPERAKLWNIGKCIARKCDGFPLAARVLGSLLRFKSSLEEWTNVMNNEIWELHEAEVNLYPHLFLSYNELSPPLRRCFSYCGIFPKDSYIMVDSLIQCWMALGYLGSDRGDGSMELRGREYLNSLTTLSFFEVEEHDGRAIGCSMHDVIHGFAQFLREGGRAGSESMCSQQCQPSSVARVKQYRSLIVRGDENPSICRCMSCLRMLDFRSCRLDNIALENFIHLRKLVLESVQLSEEDVRKICKLYNLQHLTMDTCELEVIPSEIGMLIHLRALNLIKNPLLLELPESLCDLHELQTVGVEYCKDLSALPGCIDKLINLKNLDTLGANDVKDYPKGLGKLTGLQRLGQFNGGKDFGKLSTLKYLNGLTGSLQLSINLSPDDSEGVVEDAWEAELRHKVHLHSLEIKFLVQSSDIYSSVSLNVVDALEPHQYLNLLVIKNYMGSRLPDWVVSPLNQVKNVDIVQTQYLSSFFPLGSLPRLEFLHLSEMKGLECVGRDIFAIRDPGDVASSSSAPPITDAVRIFFPKLEKLWITSCGNFKEWEDITPEEEERQDFLFMPCLKELGITVCPGLTALPHRLLNKMPLEELTIRKSTQLEQLYGNKESDAWNSISQNNRLQLID